MNVDAREISFIKHVDQEIAHCYDIVSPTGNFEVQLVKTRKDHIAAERFDFRLGNMLTSSLILVRTGKAVVHEVDCTFFENIGGFRNFYFRY